MNRAQLNIRALLVVLTVATGLLGFTASANAATRIGQPCAAPIGGPTHIYNNQVVNGTSYVVPSDGVITRWGTRQSSASFPNYVRASIASPINPASWQVNALSDWENAPINTDASFDARMAVKQGQFLGINVFPTGTMCFTTLGFDMITYDTRSAPAPNESTVGTSFTVTQFVGYRASVWADLEADVDVDGYGDETQDKCPQSAALQTTCPVLTIGQKLSSTRNAISVLATASVDTSLTASATVKVPKIGKTKAKTVKFKSKATAFTAGKLKAIKLKLPSSVRKAVNAGKKLKVTVTLAGNGLANTATTKSTIKLKR